MALLGNRSPLTKMPCRFFGDGILSANRDNFNTSGSQRNPWVTTAQNKSAVPYGHLAPSSWLMPLKAGGMSSRNVTTTTVTTTGTMLRGFPISGSAGLTVDFANATGQLISSGNGTASFSVNTNTPLLTASLLAVGSAGFSITPAATIRADGAMVGGAQLTFTQSATILPTNDASPLRTATASFAFSGSLTPYALGIMSGSTANAEALTTDSIAAAVLAAAEASPIASDIRKVNTVTVTGTGATGDEWGP